MYDFHCHILPALDDGSSDMEESIQMAKQSVEGGITHVVATPHCCYFNLKSQIASRDSALQLLQQRLDKEGIPLKLIPGAEYRVDGKSKQAVEECPSCRCGFASDPPMLMELPFSMEISIASDLFFKSQLAGIKMILAHPERYIGFTNKTQLLMDMADNGLYLQFNAFSLRKGFLFFNSLSKALLKIIEHAPEKILLGSDAHNTDRRPPAFANAYEFIANKLGDDVWTLITKTNPQKLLGI